MFAKVEIAVGDDHNLTARFYHPEGDQNVGMDKLLVILLHGFPYDVEDRNNTMPILGGLLKSKGFHCLIPDFRGCGMSGGREEDFTFTTARRDIDACMTWARAKGYEHFIFIGEGLSAALPLLDHNDESLCFVMLWPVLDYAEMARNIFDSANIGAQWKKAGYIVRGDNRISTNLIREMEETDLKSALIDIDRPLLVMHGTADTIAPVERLDYLRSGVKSRRVEITTFHDGTHGLPAANHRKSMYYHIFQFVEKYASLV